MRNTVAITPGYQTGAGSARSALLDSRGIVGGVEAGKGEGEGDEERVPLREMFSVE